MPDPSYVVWVCGLVFAGLVGLLWFVEAMRSPISAGTNGCFWLLLVFVIAHGADRINSSRRK